MIYIIKMIKLKNILLESETGLFVYPSTQTDFIRLNRWLNKSSHYAEVDKRNQRLFFPENPSGYDSLEEKLRAQFNRYNISVKFEGV